MAVSRLVSAQVAPVRMPLSSVADASQTISLFGWKQGLLTFWGSYVLVATEYLLITQLSIRTRNNDTHSYFTF